MAYVYVLKSKVSGRYYIGSTDNVERRLKEHWGGFVKTTKGFGELILVGSKFFDTVSKARWEELLLKRSAWRRKKFISELEKDVV